jgi:GT2 family glycosyltransferase
LLAALDRFPHEIIVVDDSSTDDSVAFLGECFPEIHVLINKRNSGFSESCNAGIFAAKGPYTCVANSDVSFSPTYFEVAIRALTIEELFAVKGKIVNHDGDPSHERNLDTTAILFLRRGFLRFNKTEDNRPGMMGHGVNGRFALLGCCFVAKTEVLREIGGFDTVFSPFYWEDSDLPLRASKQGYQIRYLPDAIVFHEQGSTINNTHRRYWRKLVSDRNKFIFAWRHFEKTTHWMSHLVWVSLSVPTRWLKMDLGYYVALFWALSIAAFGKRRIRLNSRNLGGITQKN